MTAGSLFLGLTLFGLLLAVICVIMLIFTEGKR